MELLLSLSFVVAFLIQHGPAMLAYLIAVVLSVIHFKRARIPSILTLLGVTILMVSTIAGRVMLHTINRGQGPQHLITVLHLQGAAQGVGLGLLVAAIFVGRTDDNSHGSRYLKE